MTEIKDKKVTDTRLSYSSATLLKNCEMKYYHHKVSGCGKDSDSEDNYNAFNIGKAFHWVLEENLHTDEKLDELLESACKAYEVESSKAMINAMLLRYLQVHKKAGLKVTKCELEITNPEFIGFIDAIMEDKDGKFWLVDLKTAARVAETTFARLKSDVQLNLYSHFAKGVAEHLGLDPKNFAGARYRVTTKSVLKRKVTESYREYTLRIAKNVKSYDIIIPVKDMDPAGAYKNHMDLHKKSMKMRAGKLKPSQNTSYCDSFFKPCEYWSQCYGDTFTSCKDALEFVASDNA